MFCPLFCINGKEIIHCKRLSKKTKLFFSQAFTLIFLFEVYVLCYLTLRLMLLYLSCITFKLDIFKIFKKSKKSKYSLHQLQMLLKSQVQGKLLYPLKHKLAQNVQVWLYFTLLFSSIMIPGLLSACLNTELHLLPVSEALNFGG